MKTNNSDSKYLNNRLFYDILVRIFTTLSVVDLAVASMVCKSWNEASRAPELWGKFDLSTLTFRGLNSPMNLNAWVDEHPSLKMTRFLKYASSLSGENINCIIFNFYVYLRDSHLISIAKRTPNLKRLVLPRSGYITDIGIETAMRSWGNLESMTITLLLAHGSNILCAIGKYCPNIVSLKFTDAFHIDLATAVVKNAPNLKVLSIPFMAVTMRGLCLVLNNLERLETVNLIHSCILDGLDGRILFYTVDDLHNHVDSSRLRRIKIVICENKSCITCKNGGFTVDLRRPFGSLEDVWLEDDIESLAH